LKWGRGFLGVITIKKGFQNTISRATDLLFRITCYFEIGFL